MSDDRWNERGSSGGSACERKIDRAIDRDNARSERTACNDIWVEILCPSEAIGYGVARVAGAEADGAEGGKISGIGKGITEKEEVVKFWLAVAGEDEIEGGIIEPDVSGDILGEWNGFARFITRSEIEEGLRKGASRGECDEY